MNTPVETTFREIINNQLGQFMQEELDSVLRKIKNRKAAGLDETPRSMEDQGIRLHTAPTL